MGFVYRYRDIKDGIIKYVGIVWSTDDIGGLYKRIKQHSNYDYWAGLHEWQIEYIEEGIKTRTDAEYFESHYVSLFDTGNWYNKSKVGWGISCYLPDRSDWKILDISRINNKFSIGIEQHDKELLFTVYNLVNRNFRKRKVNKYFTNGKDINVYLTKCRSAVSVNNNTFYFNEDNACLYYISFDDFLSRTDMIIEAQKYSVDFNNKELFRKYIYNLIGGGDNRVLQTRYGYV